MKECWICGSEGTEKHEKGQRLYCKSCFEKNQDERKQDLEVYVKLKKKLMFERALKFFEHQEVDIYEYVEAIKAVEDFVLKNPNKFDSAHEMLAAIVLIDNEIETKVQASVDKYH